MSKIGEKRIIPTLENTPDQYFLVPTSKIGITEHQKSAPSDLCQKSTVLNVKNRLCQKSTLSNVKNRQKTDIRVRIIPTLGNTPGNNAHS
jgi:hypothetical protein